MSRIREHSGRLFWGIVLIVVGVLFLLDQMDKADAGYILGHWWPVILIALGLWILITSEFRSALGGLILIGVGVVFLLINLNVLREDAWSYAWPAAIILVGLWVILRPRHRVDGGKLPEIKANDLDAANVFSGSKRIVTSQSFRGGRASAVFGGMQIDLRQAGLDQGQATIEVTAIFGGIEIFVPETWTVVVDATPILGGVDDKRQVAASGETKGTLHIKATAILGGIEIKN